MGQRRQDEMTTTGTMAHQFKCVTGDVELEVRERIVDDLDIREVMIEPRNITLRFRAACEIHTIYKLGNGIHAKGMGARLS